MARMIKIEKSFILGMKLYTMFEDGNSNIKIFKIGDTVENLRYVENEEIKIVSGKIIDIKYTMKTKLSWNKNKPEDKLAEDLTINSIIIDASSQYSSKVVEVPALEILEFENEANVQRMKFEPFIEYDITLHYSNYVSTHANIMVGDVFDKVRIINANDVGNDITGKFTVIAFGYTNSNGKLNVNTIAFKNMETDQIVVTEFNYIIDLNEVYTYNINNDNINTLLANINSGDTVTIDELNSIGNKVQLDKDVNLILNNEVIADGSADSGIIISGKVQISGNGKLVNNTPYDSNHSKGVISVINDGEVIIDGIGIEAALDDPVNNGQFGIVLYDNSKITINSGNFRTGWYCVSGNGSKTSENAETIINGGNFVSTSDYVLYHPHKGKLIINNGNFTGAAGCIAANDGYIEINGGNFNVTGTGNTGEFNDGTGNLDNACINLNSKYGDITARINGGNFVGRNIIVTGTSHNIDLKITGGTFSEIIKSEWMDPEYMCIEVEFGKYTVTRR